MEEGERDSFAFLATSTANRFSAVQIAVQCSWILLFGRYSLQLDNNIHYLIIFHVKTVTRMARINRMPRSVTRMARTLTRRAGSLARSHISTTRIDLAKRQELHHYV